MAIVVAVAVVAWALLACFAALVGGRALAVAGKRDRWRHGHREVRDLTRMHPVAAARGPEAPAA